MASRPPPTTTTATNAQRREMAARAAERRIQHTETTTTTASSSTSSVAAASSSAAPGPTQTAAAAAAAATKSIHNHGHRDRNNETAGAINGGRSSGKRKAAPTTTPEATRTRTGASMEQIGFSDSSSNGGGGGDGGGCSSPEVTFAGSTAGSSGLRGIMHGGGSARGGGVVSRGGGGRRGRGRGRGNRNKRGRIDQAAMLTSPLSAEAGQSGGAAADGSENTPSASKTFRLVSWNIDCLNGKNKLARVEEVCAILLEAEERCLPDVILLQEVDADMLAVLSARLGVGGRYRPYPPSIPVERRYFTLMFVRVSTVAVQDSVRQEFGGSRMERDLTSVWCKFNGTPVLIMTSHLESEKHSSEERKGQFNQTLRKLLTFREGPAIFAGDTNLREAEVKQEKLAKKVGDMWQVCGGNPDIRFTWDMLNNDNLVFDGGFKPRARYDRMFVNPQAKSSAKTFALLGTQRMARPEACFPSDHFGMDASFEW